jgi:glycerate 2-kinase
LQAIRLKGRKTPPLCILAGGESTVILGGSIGLGGRNQELALSTAIAMSGMEGCVFLALGSDGSDGPTDAAGGLVDGATIGRGRDQGISAAEYLSGHDSYTYLKATGDLIRTGPTLTNVMDLVLILSG